MKLFSVFLAMLSLCSFASAADPTSQTPKKPVTDEYQGVKVEDGYQWLEQDDDPAVKLACELIGKQVQEIGITLKLDPVSRKQLHSDVEQNHNYDLAYYSWDFANESYWLWPMFDPAATGPGGRNFLGYQDDDLLSSYFSKTMAHRNFSVVKQLTHEIHNRLDEKMPFIPLWQLDTQFAYHNSLTFPPDIDPLLIFTDVENWKLEKR